MENIIEILHVPFYFVRHGQTDWNQEHKIMGQADIPLNTVGLEQAQIVAKNIAHLEISHIVSSPLKKAIQTSEIIAESHKTIIVIDDLKERSMGVLQGRYKKDVGEWIESLAMGAGIEGAELATEFLVRVGAGINAALEGHSGKGPVFIVAHGGVYRALLCILDAEAADLKAKNCGVYFFSPPNLDSNRWMVKSLFE
jgi:broad specificity phosphatase PhoE